MGLQKILVIQSKREGIMMLSLFRKLLFIAVLFGLLFWSVSKARSGPPVKTPMRYELALVLGGGAALGYAHLGVLKVLEGNGVHPDLIVGTSIGAIIGGNYAAGIPIETLIAHAQQINIFRLLHFKILGLGFISWEKTEAYFRTNLDHKTFADLAIPFAAVATDLYSGEEVVLNSGDVVEAMLASASVPGIYTPVKIGEHLLVDGGLVDDLPVRAARKLGARYVIAVDVHHPLIRESIKTPLDVIRQAFYILHQNYAENAGKLADVVIRPDLHDLSYTKFSAANKGIEVGAAAARKKLPEIRALIQKISIDSSNRTGKK